VWLVSALASTSGEKAYRLLGLHWSDADIATLRGAAEALVDAQDATGGWAQLPGLNPDAYATGLALVALREAEALTPHISRAASHMASISSVPSQARRGQPWP
jgi:hypothetical protein